MDATVILATTRPALQPGDFRRVYEEALAAGLQAGLAHRPTPMVVGQPTTPMGNDIDYTQKTYYEPEGVCGFAWLNVKPGNCPFANWLKKQGYGDRDSYYGGVTVWVDEYNQSYDRKMAHASAMAKVLQLYGIRAYASGRLD